MVAHFGSATKTLKEKQYVIDRTCQDALYYIRNFANNSCRLPVNKDRSLYIRRSAHEAAYSPIGNNYNDTLQKIKRPYKNYDTKICQLNHQSKKNEKNRRNIRQIIKKFTNRWPPFLFCYDSR